MSYEEEEAARLAMFARAEELLRQHGFKMHIGGCGCCGSPWVRLTHNDEPVLHAAGKPDRMAEDVSLNMFEAAEAQI